MRWLSLLALLVSPSLWAQEVAIPQTVAVAVNRLAAIEMTFEGDDFSYSVPPELDAFREYTTDPNVVKLRVIAYQPGQHLITAVAAKTVDGKAKLSPFKSCLVVVGTPIQPPVIVAPPTTPPVTPPVDTPSLPPTAATYIYEKDETAIPGPVLSAINKINRERMVPGSEKKIVATTFDDDTVDGTGQTPEQYKTALTAARTAGLPALVVTSGQTVLHVIKDPKTEQAVLEAFKVQ